MTVALVGVGAAVAALGTRSCAIAFVAAAVLAAREPAPVLAAIGTWTCALLAGWALLGPRPATRMATPAFGAAAVLAAAGAPNVAVVLGLWAVGTAAAVVTRGPGIEGRRWAALLCASDILTAAALAVAAARGFQDWPFILPRPGIYLLVAAAALRAPLAAGSDDASAMGSLVVVRAQSVLLVAFAVAASPPDVLRTVLVVGALGFALATAARRPAAVDVTQELSLAAMALATTGLGLQPSGWTWGALAAGTLMHHLRFSLTDPRAEAFVDSLRRSVLAGLAFLPVVVAQLEASFRSADWTSPVVLLGVVGGLAGRGRVIASRASPVLAESAGVSTGGSTAVGQTARAVLPLAAVTAAAMWAPLLALPRPPGGDAISWPEPWALAAVLGAAIVGFGTAPASTERGLQQVISPVAASARLRAVVGALDRIATDRAIWAGFASVVAAAIALWTIGLIRGFL